MQRVHFDVIVVGAGPAGVTAAAGVARTGASVLLLEAGAFAGAENWSGCVYFAENLLHPDIFGADAMSGAPFERPVVRRGLAVTDGETLFGASHQDADTFRNCYTVLRPAFDPWWAQRAGAMGATYLPGTTVTSLIRRSGRVVGVHTSRGPAYADVVFLAEGDASHLVRYEGLERVQSPDFMQGVKAVFRLPAADIERRFNLNPGDGAAYEILLRNPSLAGRSLHLNMGAFLYTNRDTLSVGYVVPLTNLARNFKGNHDDLLAFVTRMPGIAEYLEGAELSAFGTKLIRTGGLTQSPLLVEDGLAVGGSACGLGIDIPCPNFTGPASATGLYFAQAYRDLARVGSPFSAANLTALYLDRLRQSRYWKDADALSAWPRHMEHSRELFGASVDLVCGKVRYLTASEPAWRRWWLLGRFMRTYYAPKMIQRLLGDGLKTATALRIGDAIGKAASLRTLGRWVTNSLTPRRKPDGIRLEIRSGGQRKELRDLPWLVRGPLGRMLPPLSRALAAVYRNDETPLANRMRTALSELVSGVHLLDLLRVLLAGAIASACAVASVVVDALRYYVFKVGAARMLAERVTADGRRLRELRELTPAPAALGMAARLATNTYEEGSTAHIRVLWPEALPDHARMAESPYWSVCPAGVYAFEPALSGHGLVTVNWQNCIKCESCWQSSAAGVRWGRHTDHCLIYRPETAAMDIPAPEVQKAPTPPRADTLRPLPEAVRNDPRHTAHLAELGQLAELTLQSLVQFEVAVANIPAVADSSRLAWPRRTGEAAVQRLRVLHAELTGSAALLLPLRAGLAHSPFVAIAPGLGDEVEVLAAHLRNGDLFEAVASARRTRETALAGLNHVLGLAPPAGGAVALIPLADPFAPGAVETALRERYPDTLIKEWERHGIEGARAKELAKYLAALPVPDADHPLPAETIAHLRAWGAIHPGVAVLALARIGASAATGNADGILVSGDGLKVTKKGAKGSQTTHIRGTLVMVPAALGGDLVIVHQGFAHTLATGHQGVARRTVRSGGLHPAGFESVQLDVTLEAAASVPLHDGVLRFLSYGYAAVALGAGDYLARRTVEQAAGRIQFPGQLKDSQGHDSVAKFGAVKALLARTLAWRKLLAAVVERTTTLPDLAAALAALAFCPKNGRMSYDAGQAFGGTGYSEDDLLARFYRDSAAFHFLSPGFGAVGRVAAEWRGDTTLPLASRLIPEAADAFSRLAEGPFAEAVQRWQRAVAEVDQLPLSGASAREATVLTVGLFHLLSACGEALTQGLPVEADAALLEVLQGELDSLVHTAREATANADASHTVAHFPEFPDLPAQVIPLTYEEIIHTEDPYASGDFLRGEDGGKPRFIPEIQLHDPALRERWAYCYQWFLDRCHTAPDDGGYYEHYIERVHSIPPDMLEGFVQNGFFATVVPKKLDGLGWRKIGYYLLVSGAMRHGDASLSLLIMASTSIGVTPLLLGMEKEIPLVAAELTAFDKEPQRLGDIKKGLDAVVASLDRPDPGRLERDFTRLVEQVDAVIRKTKVTKYLAQNFLKTFYTAALAGKRRDFGAFADGLREAQPLLAALPDTIHRAVLELPRRERANHLYLRTMGHGGVAAFALTEPTAGSDSGGVTTTARLHSVPVTPLPDGRWRFEIDGQERFLLDADRIGFDADGMTCRLEDGTLARVSTSGYDYRTDQGTRTLVHGDAEVPFHDIAQVREGNVYEFYELTGAKMWITNGRVCTQMSMYVKTDEGITGLLVDRHAEGLVVGRDEDKMGQQGSPTNEIAIDRVRVPRECVIGYEGHGQVNALETLNVGRCGLAVASVVMGRRMLVESIAGAPEGPDKERVLADCAARIFATESLCYHLIGLFDNHSTRSVRMESAVAKYACSEMFHEGLDQMELLWGPHGQTRDNLLEKARRDARILNIYEGTNEVQRFLILRELCAMAPDWEPVPIPEADVFGVRMAHYKERLRRYVKEAVDRLGDTVWADAAMQPAFFPLSEMAGELYLLDTVVYRMRWLDAQRATQGDYATRMIAVGERAAAQCLSRLEFIAGRYEQGRDAALTSHYPVESVAADAIMQEHHALSPTPGALEAEATLTCLVRPAAVTAPRPRLNADGTLAERVWRMHPADEAALATALELRARSGGRLKVQVISCGGSQGENLLRHALAAGADRAVLLPVGIHATPTEWGAALAAVGKNDLGGWILCGDGGPEAESPIGAAVAASLGFAFHTADGLAVADGQLATSCGDRPGSGSVLTLRGNGARIRPNIGGHVAALHTDLERPDMAIAAPALRFVAPPASAAGEQVASDAQAAARVLRHLADAVRQVVAKPVTTGLHDAAPLPEGGAVWALAEWHQKKAATAAFGAAARLAAAMNVPARALMTGTEDDLAALAGLARDAGMASAHGVVTRHTALSFAGARKLAETVTGPQKNGGKNSNGHPACAVAPREWAAALAATACGERPADLFCDASGLVTEGGISLLRSAYGGRVTQSLRVDGARPLLFTVAEGADFPLSGVASGFTLSAFDAGLNKKTDFDAAFTPPAETLSQAEVIVDIGYGAGSPAGMQLAEELVAALRELGLSPHLGASRKITQGLGLLGLDHQIGQTGLRVNPRILFALGISGAPQHVDYIGARAQVFAFNRDPDAPLMSMKRPGVTVHPIAGDLFVTVPALIAALRGDPEG